MKNKWLLLSTVLFNVSVSAATHYEFEVDPATFVLDGYSAHIRVLPESMPHWRFGVGVYALDFPDAIINLNSTNKDKGWQVELDSGIGLFAEYFFKQHYEGMFAGLQYARQQFNLTNKNLTENRSDYSNELIMPYAGYRWNISNRFYAQAWFGVGYTNKVSGQNKLGTEVYDINPIIPFGALHIGYRF